MAKVIASVSSRVKLADDGKYGYICTLEHDTSYATNGQTLENEATQRIPLPTRIDFILTQANGGFQHEWIQSTGKLKVWVAGTAKKAPEELANAENITTTAGKAIPALIIGS